MVSRRQTCSLLCMRNLSIAVNMSVYYLNRQGYPLGQAPAQNALRLTRSDYSDRPLERALGSHSLAVSSSPSWRAQLRTSLATASAWIFSPA